MVPGRSMILPSTIPETPISSEWNWWLEPVAGMTPGGHSNHRLAALWIALLQHYSQSCQQSHSWLYLVQFLKNPEAVNRGTVSNSAIHKAADRAVPGFAWYNSCGTEKCPLAVNGSCQQERPPEVVLYGGRPYGGFVNSAVRFLPPAAGFANSAVNSSDTLWTAIFLRNRPWRNFSNNIARNFITDFFYVFVRNCPISARCET